MFTAAASAWRFRNDDGGETLLGATWKAAQNTQPSAILANENFRLRFRAGDTGGASGTLTPRLRYSQNGGSYAEATTTTPVKLVSSAQVANGTATTTQLTGGGLGLFVAGQVRHDNSHAAVSIGASGNTEAEWVLQFDAAQVSNNDTFTFQIYNNTTALSQVTATVAVNKPVPTTAPTITRDFVNATSIRLTASTVSGATTYEWQRDSVTIQNTASLQLNDRVLVPGTTYDYRVRAVNVYGSGPWSTVDNITTPTVTLPMLNTAEGGVEDAPVTGADNIAATGGASGHAFDTWSLSAGASVTFDNERLRPGSTRSFKFWSDTGANSQVIWRESIPSVPLTRLAFRAYMNIDLVPSGGQRLMHVRNGTTSMGGFGVAGSGRFLLRDPSANLLCTIGRYVPTNQWIRVEALFDQAKGYSELRVFFNPEAPLDEPDDVIAAYSTITSGFDRMDFGGFVAGSRFWADDIGLGSFWLGPTNPSTDEKPTADAGADQTATGGQTVNLDGTGSSDPESGNLTYAWRQIDGPTVTLAGANTATPSFTYDDDAAYRALPR